MARPTATALDWINFYATSLAGGWAGNTDAAILTAANAATIANPASQATVPKPFTLTQVLGVLSAASQANLKAFAGFAGLRDDVNANNVSACVVWAAYLAGGAAIITSAEESAILAIVEATQPDPTYPAKIGAAQAAIGRPLDSDDLAVARPIYAPGTNP